MLNVDSISEAPSVIPAVTSSNSAPSTTAAANAIGEADAIGHANGDNANE